MEFEDRGDERDQGGELRTNGFDPIPPNPRGESRALAHLGYSLPEALADLIDNSIDANARNVLVRFMHSPESVYRVAIVDDGDGMSESRLKAAMQIGAETDHKSSDLGLFGMGMKTASFSQCKRLSVVTRSKGIVSGRAWSVAEINRGWQCARLEAADCARVLDSNWGALKLKRNGTCIIWDELRHPHRGKNEIERFLRGLLNRLALHLGLVFHRLLQSKRITLHLDTLPVGSDETGLVVTVDPVDPFGYPATGHKHYPKNMVVDLGALGKLKAVAHVWPARSNQIEYKLGGQAAARQGFYFYRNDRLIQAGGWNETRQHADPHMSLARVAIDLPARLDNEFALTTQKFGVEVPDVFKTAIHEARCGSISWSDYIKDADTTYRRKAEVFPVAVVPGPGVPAQIRSRFIKQFAGGENQSLTKVTFKWSSLEPGLLFALDRNEKNLVLNSRHRKLVDGIGASYVKASIFLLVRDEFLHERAAKKRDEWVENCNRVLLASLIQ